MFIVLSSPDDLDDLVRYLHERGYRASRRGRFMVDASPRDSLGDRADRERIGRDLDAWRVSHPDVEADIVG